MAFEQEGSPGCCVEKRPWLSLEDTLEGLGRGGWSPCHTLCAGTSERLASIAQARGTHRGTSCPLLAAKLPRSEYASFPSQPRPVEGLRGLPLMPCPVPVTLALIMLPAMAAVTWASFPCAPLGLATFLHWAVL